MSGSPTKLREPIQVVVLVNRPTSIPDIVGWLHSAVITEQQVVPAKKQYPADKGNSQHEEIFQVVQITASRSNCHQSTVIM